MTAAALWRAVVLGLIGVALAPSAACAALEREQTPTSTVVSRIGDERIRESSGLAHSAKYPNLAYTMNDSKNRAVVYAIQVSTGRVVGQVDLESLDLSDPESIAVDQNGRLWLGDLGDNDSDRDDASILMFTEPGPGEKKPQGLQRYPVSFADGPANVEGMMVYPSTSQIFLISKTEGGAGTLYALPETLRSGTENVATNLRRQMPAQVSDAAFTPDGRHALVKTATGVVAYDVQTWQTVSSFETPGLDKGESLTVEPGGRSILLGSEGDDSPIMRVSLPSAVAPAASAAPSTPAPTSSAAGGAAPGSALPPIAAPNTTPAKPANVTVPTLVAIVGVLLVLGAVGAVRGLRRRLRLADRHRRMSEHGHG